MEDRQQRDETAHVQTPEQESLHPFKYRQRAGVRITTFSDISAPRRSDLRQGECRPQFEPVSTERPDQAGGVNQRGDQNRETESVPEKSATEEAKGGILVTSGPLSDAD